MNDEFETIREMLEIARRSGLETEVVESFARFIQNGDDIKTAAVAALWDWDCA